MEPREIINNIKEEFSEFSLTNQNQLNFLEDVRKSIIESIKLKKNESITNLIKFIRNNSIKDEIIEFNNFKLLFSTIYFDKDTILNKSESKYNTLEISVEGIKIFKIFEENTNLFTKYLERKKVEKITKNLLGVLSQDKVGVKKSVSKS